MSQPDDGPTDEAVASTADTINDNDSGLFEAHLGEPPWLVDLWLSTTLTNRSLETTAEAETSLPRDILKIGLAVWLRRGCTRLLHLGGRSACRPSRDIGIELPAAEEPGYHPPGACTEDGDACLIYAHFRPDASTRLVPGPGDIWIDPTSLEMTADEGMSLRLRWRLRLPADPALLGFVVEGATLAPTGDWEIPVAETTTLRVTDAHIRNPLYDHEQRYLAFEGSRTTEIQTRDDLWRSFIRPRAVHALHDRLRGPDGLAEPIRTVD